MKEGAKYKFYIPTELGYGQRVRPGGAIEANMALIFEVELFEVKSPETKN
jgi:FKBP-type peptidyl-prolyl cis-trans isomerase